MRRKFSDERRAFKAIFNSNILGKEDSLLIRAKIYPRNHPVLTDFQYMVFVWVPIKTAARDNLFPVMLLWLKQSTLWHFPLNDVPVIVTANKMLPGTFISLTKLSNIKNQKKKWKVDNFYCTVKDTLHETPPQLPRTLGLIQSSSLIIIAVKNEKNYEIKRILMVINDVKMEKNIMRETSSY